MTCTSRVRKERFDSGHRNFQAGRRSVEVLRQHLRSPTITVATVQSEVKRCLHLWTTHCQASMSLEDKIKATAKNAEGRLQAAAGDITGDDRMKAEGEAKQVQSHLMDAASTLKDKFQQAAASVCDAIDGLAGKQS